MKPPPLHRRLRVERPAPLLKLAYWPAAQIHYWLCSDHCVWSASLVLNTNLGSLDTFTHDWSRDAYHGRLTDAGLAAMALMRLSSTDPAELSLYAVEHFNLDTEDADGLASHVADCKETIP